MGLSFAVFPGFLLYVFFFFPPLLFSRRRSIDTGLLYWAASRHRLFLYWPVSRCACGREGVSPDLPLPCWEATDRHGWARVWKEVAERGKVSVLVVVGREIFEQQTGRKGSSCRMGKESWPPRDEGCAGGCLEGRRAGSGSGFGEHADEVGSFIAPPAANFDSKDDQATSSVV